MPYFIGVDVGTSSARAGLVEKTNDGGKLLKYHSEAITVFNPKADFFQQSSENIWEKVCKCVKEVSSGFDKNEIVGIGFDATCSLVLLDDSLQPLSASFSGEKDQNIIMWLDHRAEREAEYINSLKHDILKYVGGKVSLEMQIPKLLWLKNNMPETFEQIRFAFDLPDYLTWRATGNDSRSICSVVCKWNYDAINQKWPEDYFKSLGLDALAEDDFVKIGKAGKILFPGDFAGFLSKTAAAELNLTTKTAVGVSMIDAHAGAIGLIGSRSEIQGNSLTSKLILIAGTSTCQMSITENIVFAPGIWGPYFGALLSDFYLIEAGQSASGILIDHMIKSHPEYAKISSENGGDKNIYDILFTGIQDLAKARNLKSYHELTRNFHLYPDFHGNRSPIGDSSLRGMISGLSMHDSIFINYLAVVQALAYSTRHIIESLYQSGREKFKSIIICGGLSKNKLYVSTIADVCQLPVLISKEEESVLLGAAMLGATASGIYKDLKSAIESLSNMCYQVSADIATFQFHNRKFKVFLRMLEDQRVYADIMKD